MTVESRWQLVNGRITRSRASFHSKALDLKIATQSLGCDLLIKGAYTQSRLRQMIFGGATQYILDNAMIPVLLAN
jgi:nucleotide-binding universal stress UspA family protein